MSFRSTSRIAARLVAQRSATQTQVIGRRAASSTSAPKKGGDTTWMIGSAAVFGSLGAFLLMPSGDKAHEAAHGSNRDRSDLVNDSQDPDSATPGHDVVEHRSVDKHDADDPKKIHPLADKYPGTIPAKQHSAKMNEYPGHATDNDGTEANAATSMFAVTSEKRSKAADSESGSETPDNVDESAAPSAGDIKDSVKQAAKSNVPEVAWNEESGKSDSETPSNVDESDAPSAKEIKDSVKQAAKSNAPEVAWDDEAKK